MRFLAKWATLQTSWTPGFLGGGRYLGMSRLAWPQLGGGVLEHFALSVAQPVIPYVIALAAASFRYIAIAYHRPGLHQHTSYLWCRASERWTIAMGVGGMALAILYK